MSRPVERFEANFPPDRAWIPFLAALLTALLVLLSVGYVVLFLQTDMTQESVYQGAVRGLSMVYLLIALLLCLLTSFLVIACRFLTGPEAPARRRTQRYWWLSLVLVLGVMLLTEILTRLRLP
ncbi:MAG TPA: hypothetical protein VIM12_14765 [Noviherbaspirillum sp.]|uniref:hypothetical protein n=1 Tax=Noviherbaspirillum sp. TaxID=1926288 RepID=UPI002F94E5FF